MAVRPHQMASDWFQKASEAMDAAMKTSAKFQEESMQWWSEMLGSSNSMQDWQKRAQTIAMEAIPTAQKGAEEYMKAMDQTYRAAVEVMQRAFESGEFRSMEDMQGRVQALWESTLGAMRKNTQAFIQANTRAMETWAELVRKSANGRAGEGHGG